MIGNGPHLSYAERALGDAIASELGRRLHELGPKPNPVLWLVDEVVCCNRSQKIEYHFTPPYIPVEEMNEACRYPYFRVSTFRDGEIKHAHETGDMPEHVYQDKGPPEVRRAWWKARRYQSFAVGPCTLCGKTLSIEALEGTAYHVLSVFRDLGPNDERPLSLADREGRAP